MTRGAVTVISVSVAALVATLWVTTTRRIPLVSGSATPTAPPITATTTPPPQTTPGRPGGHKHHPSDLHALATSAYVVLGIVAFILVVFLVTAFLARSRRVRRRLEALHDAYNVAVPVDMTPPAQLEKTAEDQLVALREGSPRNAIVACWMALERACRDSGLPGNSAETSTEFTARVLGRYATAPQAVTALAAKYREARFSEHTMTESDREQAVAALERILADLRTTHAHPTPAGAGA